MVLPEMVCAHTKADDQRIVHSTTLIFTTVGDTLKPAGTGVLIDSRRRWIVTTSSAVGAATDVFVCFPMVKNGRVVTDLASYTTQSDRLNIRGTVVATDRVRGLALIELSSLPKDVVAVRLADRGPKPADKVCAVTHFIISGSLWNVLSGVVRSVYQTKPAAGPGAERLTVAEATFPLLPLSDGPAFNNNGELVGFFSQRVRNRLMYVFLDISEIRSFLRTNGDRNAAAKTGS